MPPSMRRLPLAAVTRAAVKSLLIANSYLEAELESIVGMISAGFASGRVSHRLSVKGSALEDGPDDPPGGMHEAVPKRREKPDRY